MAKSEEKKPETPDPQQGIQELQYIQQVYQNQYTVVSNSINIVLQELQQLNSAQNTIDNMNLVEGKEVIANIGSEFYLFSKIHDPKTVLVGIGAGYLIEKDVPAAKTYVANLIKTRTDNLSTLTKNRKDLENALVDLSYRIENLR